VYLSIFFSVLTILIVIITLQFRGSPPVTDLKTVKSDEEVNNTLALFLGDRHDIKQRLVARLNEIRSKLDRSHYFKTHEVSWATRYKYLLFYFSVNHLQNLCVITDCG